MKPLACRTDTDYRDHPEQQQGVQDFLSSIGDTSGPSASIHGAYGLTHFDDPDGISSAEEQRESP